MVPASLSPSAPPPLFGVEINRGGWHSVQDARRLFKKVPALSHSELAVVTDAFGYTGKYVARRLLEEGVNMRTLPNHPDRSDPFCGPVPAAPLDLSDDEGLRCSMDGAGVHYNTCSVRFGRYRTPFEHAVENSRVLFDAAAGVGVDRIVHFSSMKAHPGGSGPTLFSPHGRHFYGPSGPRRPDAVAL